MDVREKSVFVTVGTTLFDELIETVCREDVLRCLKQKRYRKLVLQIGKGKYVPCVEELQMGGGMQIEYYRYKPTLKEDQSSASLIISHAGAASCIESLEAGKPLIAVVNEKLMDNHQSELAEAFADEGFCVWCKTSTLLETLESFQPLLLKKYTPGNTKAFADYLDSVFITS